MVRAGSGAVGSSIGVDGLWTQGGYHLSLGRQGHLGMSILFFPSGLLLISPSDVPFVIPPASRGGWGQFSTPSPQRFVRQLTYFQRHLSSLHALPFIHLILHRHRICKFLHSVSLKILYRLDGRPVYFCFCFCFCFYFSHLTLSDLSYRILGAQKSKLLTPASLKTKKIKKIKKGRRKDADTRMRLPSLPSFPPL